MDIIGGIIVASIAIGALIFAIALASDIFLDVYEKWLRIKQDYKK